MLAELPGGPPLYMGASAGKCGAHAASLTLTRFTKSSKRRRRGSRHGRASTHFEWIGQDVLPMARAKPWANARRPSAVHGRSLRAMEPRASQHTAELPSSAQVECAIERMCEMRLS